MPSLREILSIAGKLKLKLEGMPKHVAITALQSVPSENIDGFITASWENLEATIKICAKLNIPIITLYLLSARELKSREVDYLVALFQKLQSSEDLAQKQIKVSVLGKWYDLPSRLVDEVKKIIDKTKDYDRFFVNLCIGYDGQEEIVDACRLLARRVKTGKLEPEKIDSAMIKENIYSSYFIPPELIIMTGGAPITRGLLLWDSRRSRFYCVNKPWREFTKQDLLEGLEFYQQNQ